MDATSTGPAGAVLGEPVEPALRRLTAQVGAVRGLAADEQRALLDAAASLFDDLRPGPLPSPRAVRAGTTPDPDPGPGARAGWLTERRRATVLGLAQRFARDRVALTGLAGPGPLILRAVTTDPAGRLILHCGRTPVRYRLAAPTVEAALTDLLDQLWPDPAPVRIRVAASLVRDGYGWSEVVTARPATTDEEPTHHRLLGHWLAVLRAVDAGELGPDALVGVGPVPVLVDADDLRHRPTPTRATGYGDAVDRAAAQLGGSVLGTGLPRRIRPPGSPASPYADEVLAGFEELTARLADLDGAGGLARLTAALGRDATARVARRVDRVVIRAALTGPGPGGPAPRVSTVDESGVDGRRRRAAARIVRELAARAVRADASHDLATGAAGAIVPLLRFATATGDADAATLARVAGHRLLSAALLQDGSAYWTRPETPDGATGLARGTAGIGWALARLADTTGDTGAAALARSALAHGDRAARAGQPGDARDRGGWYDGATGAGLVAADRWRRTGDETARVTLGRAAAMVWADGPGPDTTLGQGALGRWELLDHAVRAEVGPVGLTRSRAAAWALAAVEGYRPALVGPGLLSGLGGVAYQVLRLHPAADLPSVLLPDPGPDPVPTAHDLADPPTSPAAIAADTTIGRLSPGRARSPAVAPAAATPVLAHPPTNAARPGAAGQSLVGPPLSTHPTAT